MTGLCRSQNGRRVALVLALGAMLLSFVACATIPSGSELTRTLTPDSAVTIAPEPSPTGTSTPLPSATAAPTAVPALFVSPTPAAVTLSTPVTPAALKADVVIMPGLTMGVTKIKVGQVIQVRVSSSLEWRITFNPVYLVSLIPDSRMAEPGPDGWFLRAVRPGESEIMLTGIAPPCAGGAPCPPQNIPRLSFAVQVLP